MIFYKKFQWIGNVNEDCTGNVGHLHVAVIETTLHLLCCNSGWNTMLVSAMLLPYVATSTFFHTQFRTNNHLVLVP